MVACLCDILDGPIARGMNDRHPTFSIVGAHLDTYSDMVSHFVVPASLLMQISGLDMLYVGLLRFWPFYRHLLQCVIGNLLLSHVVLGQLQCSYSSGNMVIRRFLTNLSFNSSFSLLLQVCRN